MKHLTYKGEALLMVKAPESGACTGCVYQYEDSKRCPVGTLQLLVKDQYGTKVLHPHNDTAKTFASIAGTKTLTLPTIKHIMALGYSIEYVHEGINL